MKLWKITHHHGRAHPGATVHLFPSANEPSEVEAVKALHLILDPTQGESIEVEFTG